MTMSHGHRGLKPINTVKTFEDFSLGEGSHSVSSIHIIEISDFRLSHLHYNCALPRVGTGWNRGYGLCIAQKGVNTP